MEKKVINRLRIFWLIIVFFIALPLFGSAVSATCDLGAELINQDPYPALAGDYVEVLFQINGINSGCEEGAIAELILDYPFSLDDGSRKRSIELSTYAGYGHNSNWNILYNIRIAADALEGDYEVELKYKGKNNPQQDGYSFERFNITIEDGRTDFEIHVQDHNMGERNIIFEILNIGNQDVEALTAEIPKQDNVIIKGSNRNIVGDLDSNEYTTADFEAIPSEGEILVNLYYTDSTNERRMLQKWVEYDPSYFIDSLDNTEPDRTSTYIVIAIIAIGIVFFIVRRRKKKNKKKKLKFSV